MTLQLPPEMEQQITVEAARHGQPPEDYALGLLQNALPNSAEPDERPFYETATPEERTRAFQAWADSHTYVTAPIIPLESLRRENLYED